MSGPARQRVIGTYADAGPSGIDFQGKIRYKDLQAEDREGRVKVVRDGRNRVYYGAEGGTRTRTGVRLLDPEPSASTNSATSARSVTYRETRDMSRGVHADIPDI